MSIPSYQNTENNFFGYYTSKEITYDRLNFEANPRGRASTEQKGWKPLVDLHDEETPDYDDPYQYSFELLDTSDHQWEFDQAEITPLHNQEA